MELEHQGSLPPRTVDRVAVNDLNDPSERPRLRSLLQRWIAGRPSFVLLEGVLFYLKLDSIGWLYATLGDLQRPGDQIASTAFRPEEQHKPIFDRLLSYCRHDYRIAGFEPTTLPLGFFAEQPRYSLRDHRNPLALSADLGPELADSLGDSYGIGKSVVDSFAFNFGDELTALVDSGLTGKDYEESYQQKKVLRQLYEADNPNTARAGSFAGALASGIPLGLKLEGYLGKAGMDEGLKRIATASAIEGGISGAGAGEGWERLFSTIGAGALSGVFGASTYGLISVLGKIRRTVGNLTGLGAAQTADDKILQAYDMSGINPDDAAKEMRNAAAQDPDLA
ncbi:MAG: hypothetical protein ACO4AU_16460, partial [bacterium]